MDCLRVDHRDPDRDVDRVLIYDADCPYCSAAATAIRRLADVGIVRWEADVAQAFLADQFGSVPYAAVFVDPAAGQVFAGEAAAGELCDRAGLPAVLTSVVADGSRGEVDGTFDLEVADVTALDRLRAAARPASVVVTREPDEGSPP